MTTKPTSPYDSPFSYEQAICGREEQARLADVALLEVRYCGFDGCLRLGHIVVARVLQGELREIFDEILQANFPLNSVIPIVAFAWSDSESMRANNSSGFNPRPVVGGTRPSHHSSGRAIDLNPGLNPYINGSLVLPPGATYDPARPGTLTPSSAPVRAFEARGWTWGGRWTTRLDYHHFEKPT